MSGLAPLRVLAALVVLFPLRGSLIGADSFDCLPEYAFQPCCGPSLTIVGDYSYCTAFDARCCPLTGAGYVCIDSFDGQCCSDGDCPTSDWHCQSNQCVYSPSSGLSHAAIGGIVAGVVIAIVLAVIAIVCCIRRRKSSGTASTTSQATDKEAVELSGATAGSSSSSSSSTVQVTTVGNEDTEEGRWQSATPMVISPPISPPISPRAIPVPPNPSYNVAARPAVVRTAIPGGLQPAPTPATQPYETNQEGQWHSAAEPEQPVVVAPTMPARPRKTPLRL